VDGQVPLGPEKTERKGHGSNRRLISDPGQKEKAVPCTEDVVLFHQVQIRSRSYNRGSDRRSNEIISMDPPMDETIQNHTIEHRYEKGKENYKLDRCHCF